MATVLSVLIIEDAETDAHILLRTLRHAGYDIVSQRVETPADLHQALAAHAWDAILCDYRLPGFDALAALKLVRETDPDVPFIIVTGVIDEATASAAMKAGAHDYVMKDNLARLVPAFERELREAQVRRRMRETETALVESEALFRSLSNCSPIGMFLANPDGHWSYCNPKCRELLGCTLSESLGAGWQQFLHPDDRERVTRELPQWMRDETAAPRQIRLRAKDGIERRVDVRLARINHGQTHPAGYVGTVADVTEQLAAQEALQASEQQFRDLFENSPDAIFVENQSGVVLDVNSAACRLHGVTRPELLGKHIVDLVPPESFDEVRRVFAQWFTGEITYYDGFTLTKDGRRVPIELRGSVVRYRGQPAVLLQARDISDRQRAEAALRDTNRKLQDALIKLERSQQQLLRQERLRALGEMASGIAHDFNNTLATILGFSELLLHRPQFLNDPDKARHYLQLINTAATDGGETVARLREFYRPRDQRDALAAIDLNQIIKKVVSLTQPRWKPQAEASGLDIAVRTDLHDIPCIAGNASDLQEALTNLLLNAIDAMPADGTATIRTRRDHQQVVIEISDTGVGMTEEVRQRCLEPFFSTKGERGTGLGLSVVYGAIQRHEGILDIQSQPGHGTTITIRPPIPATPLPVADKRPATVSMRPLRILVADDEPQVLHVIAELLAGDGHAVATAETGEAALRQFQAGKFDLVIVDRAMPGLSGDQLAMAIKSVAPKIPVVMLTGFGVLMNAASEKPSAVDLVVSKPVTLEHLRDALTRVRGQVTRSSDS